MSALFEGPDGLARCRWCGGAPEFLDYHDREWGFPVAQDTRLFEKLCLESFQSGLSWRTILNKREGFRAAFDGFDFYKVAQYGAADVDRLLGDAAIVRHRGKIAAVINNAARAVEMVEAEGTLAAFFWRYEPRPEELGPPQTQSTSQSSIALARELKRRGWKFLGPTTIFAFMQAMGLINDHAEGCSLRAKAVEARTGFQPP
ncbi:DNA-3-methyladenine glycosylase I [Tritonibacter horizontis]|uniref:DNA-3-methyladenine glycosylase 1 n=1 Tax=Tritonibacter horizontis TaxID=1768241 RepID=A0A132BXD3_9RHOB|nr:DNA-3-methyladenine glycosylase I [Tritonibacter horizontis]KUP93035.1 DNA-3-methyladenine glycosylase 1 [Tritonibacter horizontis]